MTMILQSIQLPEAFIDKIRRSFQEKGAVWLQALPSLVDCCVTRWELSDLRLSDELSFNLVLFARHPKFGEVALKIGVPHTDLFSEIRSIRLFQGRGLCRCFDSDESLGAMLLERIVPGENLWSINDPLERYRITADIYRQMVVHPPDDHNLPLFSNLIEGAIQRSANHPQTPAELLALLHQLPSQYASLENANGGPVVLHCDLHHGNILRDEHAYDLGQGWRISPGWRAIDPKGFVGARPIECARFIENEIDSIPADGKLQALETMFTIFSEALGTPKQTLAQALIIDNILSTYWCVEDHCPEEWVEAGLAQHRLFVAYTAQSQGH
ncbi:MAG: hypothetical protein HPY85_15065 [Anaerolineae bacterium]|nr:hypothetical protein [Anaerolineae bacterium]